VILAGRVLYSIFFVRSGWGHLTKRDAMITTECTGSTIVACNTNSATYPAEFEAAFFRQHPPASPAGPNT
jgi:hypothetical protein